MSCVTLKSGMGQTKPCVRCQRHFTADTGGVFIVMETLGLSRPFPRLTGWFIEPIARRIGRKSVEGSLGEFLTGIRGSAGLPVPKTSCC